ncbi:hypothetical protein BpHYR1_053966 [Brachionus plicatilis]|uniref:Uncharacterized protein n=1 Tax=Brachionus plicatilis TaxID=10195 RepID=A0A3M7TB89_BRAPC|nr:hypothetical protein BpHYR1_053966 [Brachionus plicatilis]
MVSEEIRLDNDDTLDDTSDQDDFQEPVTIKSRGTGKIYLHHKNYETKLEYFCRYRKNGCKVAMYALTANNDELVLQVTKKQKAKSQSSESVDQQNCPKCNIPMLKRRYWYCKNKC